MAAPVRSARVAYHDAVRDTIAEGCQAGEFRVTDVSLVTMAILDMLNGIREWYSPAGRLGRDEVIARYTGLVFTMLGAEQGQDGAGRQRHDLHTRDVYSKFTWGSLFVVCAG
jgi:tetracycline repressor-like protein